MKNNIVNVINALKFARIVSITPTKIKLQPVALSVSASLSRQYADRVRGAPSSVYRH